MSKFNLDLNNIDLFSEDSFSGDYCESYYGIQKIKKQQGIKSEKERTKGRKLNKRRKVAKIA